MMAGRVREGGERLIPLAKRYFLGGRGADVDLVDGKLALEDQPVGPAVDDPQVRFQHLQPGHSEAVVEAGVELEGHHQLPFLTTHQPEQLVVGLGSSVHLHRKAVGEQHHPSLGLEASL
jgi:hypothetical protein